MSNPIKTVQATIRECTTDMSNEKYILFLREIAEWATAEAEKYEWDEELIED